MNVQLTEKNNGYIVELDNDTHKQYVFKSTEIMEMLEFVGRHILGRRVKVQEN